MALETVPEIAKALKTRLELYEEAGFELEPSAESKVVVQDLESLRQEIGDCKRCKLCASRQNLVFGVGNPNADLVFVGEAPGRDEDEQGEPFVGRSGKLLTKMIE
ncbi:MAG: hypothetical protein JKY15_06785, partial [Deltaproteobacteria bacterium]|nr:hypothetical protein [Deltaproteobacteria bacterium]